MNRYFSLVTLTAFLATLVSLLTFMGAKEIQAQIDAFTFFIPYPADILDDQFDIASNDEHPASAISDLINDDIVTTISIAVMRNDTVIYYDQWEDELEGNLISPQQTTTQIWGDNNPGNGMPPGFTSDVLQAGDVIILQNVVIIPRNTAQLFFDGGDKFTGVGGNLAVSLAGWPQSAGPLFAGAWALYPTSRWDTEYLIPIGEDLVGLRGGFGKVGFDVQALKANTTLDIDLDGNGTIDVTQLITRSGGHFTQISQVQTGAKIQASDPVQVHLLAGDPTQIPIAYEARTYTIVPHKQWADDYIAPRSSDGDYWLYNPHATPLTINITTLNTTTNQVIPAGSVIRYADGVPLSTATGVRFKSSDGRSFYGIAALDQSFRQEWGYSLIPVKNLTSQVLIGWGVGNINPTPDGDESRLYVTAITTTTVSVDFNNDGTVDQVVTVPALAEFPITDPDHDITGAFLFSSNNKPFVVVWGQDQSANPQFPSIDAGTNIIPLPSLVLQKTMNLIVDKDNNGLVTWGDTVRFTLQAFNNSDADLLDGVIKDNLPDTVSYVPGSTKVEGQIIPDDTTGTPFPLDVNGYNVGIIKKLGTIKVTFEAIVKENVTSIENVAIASSPNITPTDPGGVDIPIPPFAHYQLDKRLIEPANGQANPGDTVKFGIAITSTGNLPLAKLPVTDTFITEHLNYVTAEPFLPDLVGTGVLTWSDLARADRFGLLPPGRRIDLIVTFQVANPLPNGVTNTVNFAGVKGATGTDGIPLPPQDDDEDIDFPLPTPTLTPSPTPLPPSTDDEDDGGGDGGDPPLGPPSTSIPNPPTINPPGGETPNTPTPQGSPTSTLLPPLPGTTYTPTPTGFLAPPGAATATVFPVALLPETGQPPDTSLSTWALLIVVCFGIGVSWLVIQHYHNEEKRS